MASRFIAGLLFVPVIAATGKAMAHPLGNFSINQYAAIGVHRDEIRLRYIVDLAEIPTFQEIQANGINPTNDDSGLATYLANKVDMLRAGLIVEANGQRLVLSAESREIIFPPGAGGLPTMKIGVVYKAKLPTVDSKTGEYLLSYRDNNFAGRAGWKEIIAIAEPGVRILHSSAPEMDRSSQLNDYPTDLLNSPPQELDATVGFTTALPAPPVASANGLQASGRNEEAATGKSALWRKNAGMSSHKADIRESAKPAIGPVVRPGTAASDSSRAHEKNPPRLQANLQETPRNRFTELMAAKQLNLGIALLALVVAVGLGAFHALEPGHGKTLVAAYLVGSRGTAKQALLLGLTVTAAHTAGVYLLGAVTLYASQYIVPERLYPWLGVLSGVLIAGLGGFLLARRYFGEDAIPTHHHGSHDHNSGHGHFHGHHPHDHDRAHSHGADPQVSPRELLTLGISGGIIPCPAALVVLLSAVSMQRIGFGLLLIVAFSVGLAAVLITIGLFMVYARHFMSRFQANNRFTTRWLPMTSSAFIFLFGIALTLQALQTAGILPTHL